MAYSKCFYKMIRSTLSTLSTTKIFVNIHNLREYVLNQSAMKLGPVSQSKQVSQSTISWHTCIVC